MNNQKRESILNKEIPQEIQTNPDNKTTSDIADTLAMVLIDKIISTAVITSKVNQTYNTLNDHCFNYLTNFINPYLETNFIFYENGVEDPEYQKNQIYFSRKPLEKINTWDIIPEPGANEIDRYANTKTKVMKFRKYTDMKIDGVKEYSSAFDIDEDNKYSKRTGNENILNESNDEKNNKNKEKDKSRDTNKKEKTIREPNKENKDINNSSIKQINQSLSKSIKSSKEIKTIEKPAKKPKINLKKARMEKFMEDMAPKKKEKEEILEISIQDDLPKESYENIYSVINSSDENNRLRRERELQIEQKNASRLLEIEREKRAKQKLYRRIDKDFDSNRLTFDPNGKIINLRTTTEQLVGDFVSSRIRIKPDQYKKRELLELKDVVYPIPGKELTTGKETKYDDAMVNKEIMNKIEADISQIKVEKNFEFKNDKNNKNNKEKDKGSVLPSGYNFDKFVPEVGVIVTGENEKEKKEGGFEYVKKYNKPSFNELSRFISESINMNSNNISSLMNSNSDLNANNKSINNDDNNYIGYKEEFNENNPLMQNVHKMNNNLKYLSPDFKKFRSLNIINSNMNPKKRNLLNSYDKINTEIEQYQSIQLSKNFEENHIRLKNIFDEPITSNLGKNYLKSINVNNLDRMNYFEKAVLPFKKITNKKKLKELGQMRKEKENQIKKNSDEAYINKFNSEIINNKDWGKEDDDPLKAQQKLREEMENENKPNNIRLPRINNYNNRMKNLGIQIMSEGNNNRQRKMPLFGGNLK